MEHSFECLTCNTTEKKHTGHLVRQDMCKLFWILSERKKKKKTGLNTGKNFQEIKIDKSYLFIYLFYEIGYCSTYKLFILFLNSCVFIIFNSFQASIFIFFIFLFDSQRHHF